VIVNIDNPKFLYKGKIDNLSLQYKNKTVENPYYTVIKLKNSGSSPIKTNDFESNIQIKFNEKVTIFETSILDRQPKELDTNISIVNSNILIKPTLFNSDDYITIGILSSLPSERPVVNARIIGIKSIKESVLNNEEKSSFLGILLLLTSILIMGLYSSIAYDLNQRILSHKKNSTSRLRIIKTTILCLSLCFATAICTLGSFELLGINFYSISKYSFLTIIIIIIEASVVLFIKDRYSSAGWFKKGNTLFKLNRYDEAIRAYDKSIELKPDDDLSWYNKGNALFNLNRYDEAIRAYDKSIELKPDDDLSWFKKGNTLFKLNRYDEAIRTYKRSLELNADNASALYNIACIYAILENKIDSLSNLEQAIKNSIKYKNDAKTDTDFKIFWNDDDFKRITN
jgi:tetratricopeptide (TPR) repeat protein